MSEQPDRLIEIQRWVEIDRREASEAVNMARLIRAAVRDMLPAAALQTG